MSKKSWSKWTPSVIEQFRLDYPYMPWNDLVAKYSSPKSSLVTKASEFGIRREVGPAVRYTKDDDALLEEMFRSGANDEEIGRALGKTAYSVTCRRQRLGLLVGHERWSEWEENILRTYYSNTPAKDVSAMLNGRSRNAVVTHAMILGIPGYKPYHGYTLEEEQFIAENYLHMTDDEIAEILGHPRDSIKNRRNKLGFHRPKSLSKYESAAAYFRKYNFDWKRASMEQCGYKCVISGKRFDEIHHLVSLNTIIVDACSLSGIDLDAFDPNYASVSEKAHFLDVVAKEQSKYPLGVCLSHEIHMEFHREYGYGNNTPEQFNTFICDHYPDRKIA